MSDVSVSTRSSSKPLYAVVSAVSGDNNIGPTYRNVNIEPLPVNPIIMPHTLFNYPSWQSGSSPTGTPISYLPIGESSNLGSNPALPTRLQHNQVAIGSQSGAYNNDPGNNDFMPMQNGTLSNSSGYYGEILATNINSNPGDQLVSTFPTEGSSEGRTVQGQMHEGSKVPVGWLHIPKTLQP
ncbi:uncharacterized protein ATNIH1004_010713 [Aspergillus tanneri]|uniref:Uncharacterized protein n=1 Tax=Aspergillus tanneri TaxID=1220188 RepID=A0A5M9M8X8_9EURO|nr:uncharacterized protein ATNIH1004_010713 [Aspergillus tanneri]KAA8641774.1 hypothetical protein ATNIH1004_010713 [Aspergillus tanneri]